jgi:hypothetical protein
MDPESDEIFKLAWPHLSENLQSTHNSKNSQHFYINPRNAQVRWGSSYQATKHNYG